MHSLLRLMNGVYAPQIFGSKAWPESIKKDFTGHFHKVRARRQTRDHIRHNNNNHCDRSTDAWRGA